MSFQGLEITINFNDKSELYRHPPSFLIYQRTSSWCSCLSWTGKWLSFMRNGLSNETRQRHPPKSSPHPSYLHYHRPMTRVLARGLTLYWSLNVIGLPSSFYTLLMNTSFTNNVFLQTFEIKWQKLYFYFSQLQGCCKIGSYIHKHQKHVLMDMGPENGFKRLINSWCMETKEAFLINTKTLKSVIMKQRAFNEEGS